MIKTELPPLHPISLGSW